MAIPGHQLLVIDDDDSVRESIAVYLEDSGYLVHQTSSGKDALLWLETQTPDVVLTDLRMPDIDGLTILKRVHQSFPDLPVIVVSGMGVVKDVIEALRLGAVDYLVKPIVDMEVLVHAIHKALERSELLKENLVYRQELEHANNELQEYVRVLERDQKAGRRVQSKLLPDAPAKFGRYNVDYKLIPSLYLSGDFIDFGLLSNRYLAFYLTDVSGHGAASAFVTVWLKQLVRRYFRESQVFRTEESFETDAGRLMGLINKEIIQADFGVHMTCFVGVIDTQTDEMRYVFGGHLPFPILASPDGCEYLSGKGKPLGIFPNAEWEVHRTTLCENSALYIFSDGILEVLAKESLIEKEKLLLDVVKDHANCVESLVEAFGIAGMDAVPDDIAILKVELESQK